MITEKFGQATADHIQEMMSHRIDRKILSSDKSAVRV